MKMYLESGFLNAKDILDSPYTFITVVGARGIGKSFGFMKELLDPARGKFILLRLTQAEAELVATPEANPFKPIDRTYEERVKFKKVDKNSTAFFLDGNIKGLIMALSTFAKVRGADFSDYDYILFDEFIPEKHIKKISHAGEALKNCFETVNRNRELQGRPPVKLIMLANAMNFNNDILIEFKLTNVIRKMQEHNQQFHFDEERSLLMVYPQNSPISERKKETALYKLQGRYNDMALDNEFREYYGGNIRSMNLKGYKGKIIYGDMCFYRSLNADRTWYVTTTAKGSFPEQYTNTDYEQMQFCKRHLIFHDLYLQGKFIFETPELELRFLELMKMT